MCFRIDWISHQITSFPVLIRMRKSVALTVALLCFGGLAYSRNRIRVLDPAAVPVTGDPAEAVISVEHRSPARHLACDLVVAGGGLGGVAAAVAGVRAGVHVCMTEETKWLGGQMTSQGVSALDENRWIETTGATATYHRLRQYIREFYAPALLPGVSVRDLNPGACWVSALCFEPKAGLHAINRMLAAYRTSGELTVLLRNVPVAVTKTRGKLTSVLAYGFETHQFTRLNGTMFIDATELGDVLLLSGARFRVGAESRAETGEPDAPESAHPDDLQSFTYPFVLAEGGSRGVRVKQSPEYTRWRHQFSFTVFGLHDQPLRYAMFARLPGTPGSFWAYRRLIAPGQFVPGRFASSLSMINWEGNDVCDPGYLSTDPLVAAKAFHRGKQAAMRFAWWLQNEAPHDGDDGRGFGDLLLRFDVLGSSDGLSQYPYIRESRRIVALRTVREQDLAEPAQAGARAAPFGDSVGIGYYPIDIHGCGSRKPLPKSKPFQIPLGALLSQDTPNLIAGGKDLGTTHITNGAFRLHPTEWAVGQAAGALAAWATLRHQEPAAVLQNKAELRAFQWSLLEQGQPLVWFDDVPLTDRHFAAIQFASLEGLMALDQHSLHFRPDGKITGAEAVSALRKLTKMTGVPVVIPPGMEQMPEVQWQQLAFLGHGAGDLQGVVLRGDFAQWLIHWL